MSIKREEISDADIFDVISYAEKKISSKPEGRVINLALLFYLIRMIEKTGVDFLVKGGVVMQYCLGDCARPTGDVDVIINSDPDILRNRLEKQMQACSGSISFKEVFYAKSEASSDFYYDNFTFRFDVFHFEEKLTTIVLDGIYGSIKDEVKPINYMGPSVISENFVFNGVAKEYVMAEKIMAITNELPRPYKHAVDVYSLIHTNVDVPLLKCYLDLILSCDNEVRKKIGKDVGKYIYNIWKDKVFQGRFFWPALQAGYAITFEEMKNEINLWMKKNLQD